MENIAEIQKTARCDFCNRPMQSMILFLDYTFFGINVIFKNFCGEHRGKFLKLNRHEQREVVIRRMILK
jgi:hypothetical protein